ncbi:uncharacterized protein LOC131943807 [Physella acuta]|uniref:uncharacterized protein LOC131943807 n=1 Tax=Physella acuta TaxID=109671 RepID=UPI0027DB537A|nr:uncharacterized protein LOC131943807 [Physella acuta]
MSAKPDLPHGFLGAQPKFSELHLKTDSHKDAEFKVVANNNVSIKLKTGIPVKVVTKLTRCRDNVELPEYVLIQRKDDSALRFHVGVPESGFYKFQIFSLSESEATESLPNVYNYLIEFARVSRPAQPYVKAYTKFYKDHCYLDEPLFLDPSETGSVHFKMIVPKAQKVAIHCGEEWFHLAQKGDWWEGKAEVYKYRGKVNKATVNANYDKDGTSYDVLLEYKL